MRLHPGDVAFLFFKVSGTVNAWEQSNASTLDVDFKGIG